MKKHKIAQLVKKTGNAFQIQQQFDFIKKFVEEIAF